MSREMSKQKGCLHREESLAFKVPDLKLALIVIHISKRSC